MPDGTLLGREHPPVDELGTHFDKQLWRKKIPYVGELARVAGVVFVSFVLIELFRLNVMLYSGEGRA